MRSPSLPVLVVLLLLGMVYLLPGRGAPQEQDRLLALLRVLQPDPQRGGGFAGLELNEPPAWAVQRGTDEILRSLDRLQWGGHEALVASRRALERHAGQLTAEVLARLEAVGDANPILASKLVALLGTEPPHAPGVLDELIRRAHSPSGIVARAAVRALAIHPDPAAVAGLYPRLDDADGALRELARGALARRAQAGDEQARDLILEALDPMPPSPDLAYVTVLEDFDDERSARLLRELAERPQGGTRLVALAALLKRGDAWAAARFEEMLAGDDAGLRRLALRAASAAGRLVGRASWRSIAESRDVDAMMLLARMLLQALASSPEDAALALGILEDVATDPAHPARVQMIDVLFARGHAWAVEETRRELGAATGAWLGQTADRVLSGDSGVAADMVQLALERLAEPSTTDVDRALLCRLVARLDPERAAATVVGYALQQEGVSRTLADAVLPLLGGLGEAGLRALAPHVDEDAGAVLAIFASTQVGSASALPLLERLALDRGRDPDLRREALDAIVRLREGPRAEVLRRVAEGLEDETLRARARLLFWNYL